MRILSRYLLREHVGPFLFALGALTGLMVLNQVAKQFGNLIGKGLPWIVIAEVFGLSLPFILAMTVPMAVLVAALYAFSRLGSDNEITALKAGGVHLVRFVSPSVKAAALLSAAVFLFVDQVLPRSNHQLKTLLVDIQRKKPTFVLTEQMINAVVQGQLFLRAGRIDQAADRMRDVVIYDLANENRRRTIYADSGYIRYNQDRTDLFLTLFDGYVHDYDRAQAGTFRRVFFRTDLVRVRGVSNTLQRTEQDEFRGDREMSICEMNEIVAADHRALAGIDRERRTALERDLLSLVGVTAPRPDTSAPVVRSRTVTAMYCAALARLQGLFSPREARAQQPLRGSAPVPRRLEAPATAGPGSALPGQRLRYAPDPPGELLRNQLAMLDSRSEAARQHAASYQVEIHKKYAIALSCLVFVLVGAPVALRFPRGGIGLVIGGSVVIFGFYYVGLIGGETLADRLIVSPFWAMWGPNLVMSGAGLALFARLGRERVGARGGWSERLLRLGERMAGRS